MNLKNRKILAAALVVIVSIAACCKSLITEPGTFLSSEVTPMVLKVLDRHDGYVDTLKPQGSAAMLEESAELRTELAAQPTIATEWFRMYFEPVAERHDEWVRSDPDLLPFQVETYLRSTEIARDFYEGDE